jgi:DNA-binding YbaB/EbfC family protein
MALGFGKVGELYKLQKEARAMQKKMKAVIVDGESKSGEVVVRINGVNEVIDIDIDDSLLNVEEKDVLIKQLKQAFKSAQKKLQREMTKDMDISKLKGMMGM